jgi:hypothetical protein
MTHWSARPFLYQFGKLLSPERRRCAVDHAQEQGMSERWACRLVNQPRGTQRYRLTQREDEDALTHMHASNADVYEYHSRPADVDSPCSMISKEYRWPSLTPTSTTIFHSHFSVRRCSPMILPISSASTLRRRVDPSETIHKCTGDVCNQLTYSRF